MMGDYGNLYGSESDIAAALGAYFGCMMLFVVVILALYIFIFWKILTKAGYSGWLSLLNLIGGIGTLIILFLLAFGDWPALKQGGGVSPPSGGGYQPPPAPAYQPPVAPVAPVAPQPVAAPPAPEAPPMAPQAPDLPGYSAPPAPAGTAPAAPEAPPAPDAPADEPTAPPA